MKKDRIAERKIGDIVLMHHRRLNVDIECIFFGRGRRRNNYGFVLKGKEYINSSRVLSEREERLR